MFVYHVSHGLVIYSQILRQGSHRDRLAAAFQNIKSSFKAVVAFAQLLLFWLAGVHGALVGGQLGVWGYVFRRVEVFQHVDGIVEPYVNGVEAGELAQRSLNAPGCDTIPAAVWR